MVQFAWVQAQSNTPTRALAGQQRHYVLTQECVAVFEAGHKDEGAKDYLNLSTDRRQTTKNCLSKFRNCEVSKHLNHTVKRKTHPVFGCVLLVAGAGFEPTTSGLWARRATWLLYPAMDCARIVRTAERSVN